MTRFCDGQDLGQQIAQIDEALAALGIITPEESAALIAMLIEQEIADRPLEHQAIVNLLHIE